MAAIYLSSIINIHQNGKCHTSQGIGQQENHNILPFVLRPEIRKKILIMLIIFLLTKDSGITRIGQKRVVSNLNNHLRP